MISPNEILSMQTQPFIEWLTSTYSHVIPTDIQSVEDMDDAARLLGTLANEYAYLQGLLCYAQAAVRAAQRAKDKEQHGDAIDKRDSISFVADAIKLQYQAVSRAITVRTKNNEELSMSADGSKRMSKN